MKVLLVNDFNIVQAVEGQGQILLLKGQAGIMDVGGGPAVLGQLDIGVLENVIFAVNDWPLAPDKDDGIVVIHRPDFIGGQEFAAGLLVAGGCGAVGAFGNALVPGSDGFFPQHFGNVFVRTLLIPAEIYQRICITHQALPIVFEQGL